MIVINTRCNAACVRIIVVTKFYSSRICLGLLCRIVVKLGSVIYEPNSMQLWINSTELYKFNNGYNNRTDLIVVNKLTSQ